jgi:phage baseplate assembly protein W
LGIKLSFNDVGIFSTNYNSTDQAKANLRNLILTKVGERYEQPTFGCNLLNILFQPMSDDIIGNINDIIQTPVSYWLPYISIENIDISNLRIKYLPMRIGGISYSALLNLVLYYVHKLLKNISRGTQ